MSRPKKEIPRHGKYYEYKAAIGHDKRGKTIRKSFYSTISLSNAKEEAVRYKMDQELAERTEQQHYEDVSFKEAAEKWLSLLPNIKDSTYEDGRRRPVEKHLIPYFGDKYLSEIKASDLKLFMQKMSENYSDSYIAKFRLCLSGIFNMAMNDDNIAKNPCGIKNENLKYTSKKVYDEKPIYNKEQLELVKEFAKTHRFGLDILLLLQYGLRRGELLGIRWDDVDIENRVLHIRHAVADVKNRTTKKYEVVIDDPKTKFSVRDVPLTDEISVLLSQRTHFVVVGKNEHKKEPGREIPTEFVFTAQDGKMLSPHNWSRRHLDVFMDEMHQYYLLQNPPVDIPVVTSHRFRHSRASAWVNDGLNLFAIANVMGWGDLKMLRKKYAHPDTESSRAALKLD